MNVTKYSMLFVVVAMVAYHAEVAADPLGTAFTYQGQLKQGGVPVSGRCDLQFTLWNAVVGPAQVGLMVPLNNVSVTNGLFTAKLDFGNVFDGDARWLQIAARCPPGAGSYTTLVPRQELTPGPHALFATKGGGGGTSSFPAPAYDSGWVAIAAGESMELVHNLGGNADNYVVDLQFKDAPGPESWGIHSRSYGGDRWDDFRTHVRGGFYFGLTTSSITVSRQQDDLKSSRIRIRIWTYEAPAGACCLENGSCAQLKPTDCALQNGSYRHNSSCTANLCNGACCISGIAGWFCQDNHTAETCAVGTMVYKGDGTQCNDPGLQCP